MTQTTHSKAGPALRKAGGGISAGGSASIPRSDQGKEVLKFIEGETVVSGDGAGEPVQVMPWQRRFIVSAFRSGVRTAALSLPRSNAKTATLAFVASCFLRGPLAVPNSHVIICAASIEQARLLFNDVLAALPDPGNKRKWKVSDSNSGVRIQNKGNGVQLRVIGSDPKKAHGLRGVLYLLDEPAQWSRNEGRKMFNALHSALGKIPGARLIALGTRPERDDHWFAKLLDGGADFSLEYKSEARKTWWSMKSIRKANPAFEFLPSLREDLLHARDKAKADDEERQSFIAYRLNQGVPETLDTLENLIDLPVFQDIEVPEVEIGPEYVAGLDLSKSWAMTGAAALGLDVDTSGRHPVDAFAVWPEKGPLEERSKDGSADYRRFVDDGDLVLAPGYTVPIEAVFDEMMERWGRPVVIVADFYRRPDLLDVAASYGYFEDDNLIFRRMGPGDGGEDVRRFRKMAKNRDLAIRKAGLIRHAFGTARVVQDSSGNEKLAKETERARAGCDDAATAVVLAAAQVDRMMTEPVDDQGPVMVFESGADDWGPEWD